MKKNKSLGVLLSLFILFVGISGGCCTPVEGCIDKSQICETCYCTEELDPVCGCNRKTYDNPCIAKNAGVMWHTKGKCK